MNREELFVILFVTLILAKNFTGVNDVVDPVQVAKLETFARTIFQKTYPTG